MKILCRFVFLLLSWTLGESAGAANFTAVGEVAAKFGVHEIVLTGDSTTANPFDTLATVTFTPPSGAGQAKTVPAFFDGANTWRARVYVSEPGEWTWLSRCETDRGLAGQRGAFTARDSPLPGRLLSHPKNPRHWMTENGRWFLNLSDTAYFLLCAHDGNGEPVSDDEAQRYLRDDVARGITSVRCCLASRASGFVESPEQWRSWFFADTSLDRFRLENLQCADRRLRLLLDTHPGIAVQLIMFPLEGYQRDDRFWAAMTPVQRERLLRNLVARFAAYPQLFWLMVNDAHYGPKFPNNNAMVREIGAYLQRHDPWQHPRSTGHARGVSFVFGAEDWATYVHIEHAHDLGAEQYARYDAFAKPVFLGEDRYEQDHGPARDPAHMRYWQRRLFWAWLLSGGSANYGGRWWAVHPYGETATKATAYHQRKAVTFSQALTGLDSVAPIRDYFARRGIELSDFVPDHALVTAPSVTAPDRAPKLMRRDRQEFLIYHPNAAADGQQAELDRAESASVVVDLGSADGPFAVEWFCAADGDAQPGERVAGGKPVQLTAPWPGHDVVLRLRRDDAKSASSLELPRFWRTRLDQVDEAVRTLKRGTTTVLARTPGERNVYLVAYGAADDRRGTANYNSAVGGRDPFSFARKDGTQKPVIFLLGPVHGQEVEGIAGLLNLIAIAETGRDLRGRDWGELAANLAKCRVLLVPCGSPDGRARCPYDSWVGIDYAVHERVGMGTRPDGSNLTWPSVKRIHPMQGPEVGTLGTYWNDRRVNLMHDEWFDPMTPETRAFFKLARDEAPDYIVSLHTHAVAPVAMQAAYVPWTVKETIKEFGDRLQKRYAAAGLPHLPSGAKPVEDGKAFPPPYFNLVSALHHACGAVAFVHETPCGVRTPPYPQVNHDQLLDLQLLLYDELFRYALSNPVNWLPGKRPIAP